MSRTVPVRPLAAAAALAFLAGCASTTAPVIYQPPQASQKTQNKAARVGSDLAACRAEAERAVGRNAGADPSRAGDVARRGAIEFVDKAVESLVVGTRNAWERARGAGAGAAAGTLTGMLLNWNEPDGVHREYVELCLRDRGHKVLGWR